LGRFAPCGFPTRYALGGYIRREAAKLGGCTGVVIGSLIRGMRIYAEYERLHVMAFYPFYGEARGYHWHGIKGQSKIVFFVLVLLKEVS